MNEAYSSDEDESISSSEPGNYENDYYSYNDIL